MKNNSTKKNISENVFMQHIQSLDRSKQKLSTNLNDQNFLDFLLSQNSDEINSQLFFLAIEASSDLFEIISFGYDELYFISDPGQESSNHLCVQLGGDFIDPPVEIPTYDQFYEMFAWLQKITPKEFVVYNTVDDLVEQRVLHSLKLVESLQEFSRLEILPWSVVQRSLQGEEIRNNLLSALRVNLSEIRENVSYLKASKAPLFLQEENRLVLERSLVIMDCLKVKN